MSDNTVQIRVQAQMDISDIKAKVQGIQSSFSKLKLPNNIGAKLTGQFDDIYRKIDRYNELLNKPVKTKGDLGAISKSAGEIDAAFIKLNKTISELNAKDIKLNIDNSELEKATKDLDTFQKEFQEALSSKMSEGNVVDSFLKQIEGSKSALKGVAEDMREALAAGDFKGAQAAFDELFKSTSKLAQIKGFKGLDDGAAQVENFKEEIQEFITTLGKEFSPSIQNIDELRVKINNLSADQLQKIEQYLSKIGTDSEDARAGANAIADGFNSAGEAAVRANGEIEQLTQRVQYFFGLQNQIQLFKRVVRDAYETVRELDKSMTETAVVTDFSVGDMWAQLPEYTARAKELGATINDLYQANTLYYQQGLNSTQAMQLGTETLKMARIAGMEAAEATDAMTAALRGFNMELNDTSAQRVNDVYSRLAAVTASDTEEISTAVEKTASLAYSAGMDIEQTSAFLAQIIETTREAPETAGTALKTIIARFGEVKKLSDEGLTTGVDAEGEEIDINKVDGALKTAGISLKEFIAGNESLGDVFLRLSERWGTLSVEQQRYIATMAAGARQQSRFIAMMQNVERTQYLMNEAYNAEGASDVQFNKTLEGLDAMLNQLKDEWQQFIMGIANSDLIKDFLKIVTTALKTVNNIISSISDGVSNLNPKLGSVTKTILSLGTFIGGLNVAGSAIGKGTGFLGNMLSGKGGLVGAIAQKLAVARGPGLLANWRNTGFEIGEALASGAKESLNLRDKFNLKLFDFAGSAQGLIDSGKLKAKEFLKGFTSFLGGPGAAIGGAAVVAMIAVSAASLKARIEKETKEAAEEVVNNFKESTQEYSKNLEFLSSNKKRFEELAEGVDEFGNNLSLTAEEYKEYKQISQQVADISPDLVKSYTDEGEALIGKADALKQVIEAQKESQALALKEYTSNESLTKLIDAATLNQKGVAKTIIEGQHGTEGDAGNSFLFSQMEDQAETQLQKSKIDKKINDALKSKVKNIDFQNILSEMGRDIDFDNLDLADARWIENNKQNIINKITEGLGEDKEEVEEILESSLSSFNDVLATTIEDITPISDLLNEHLKSENLDAASLQIPSEFISTFSDQINDISYKAITDSNFGASAAKQAAESYARSLSTLIGNNSKYAQIIEKVNDAQEKYLKTVGQGKDGTKEYEDATSSLIQQLRSLADQYGTDTVLGKSFSDTINAQIAAIQNYAQTVEVDFASAFNTLNDEIESAEKKIEEFSEASSKDYYSTANSFKSMIETMKKEENWEGDSKTLRAGANALLSKDFQTKSSKQVKDQIELIDDWFEEGKAGADSFMNYLMDEMEFNGKKFAGLSYKNGELKFAIDDDETFSKLAEQLHLSDEALASLLTKAKQFYNIDFSNVKQAFTALSTADNAVHGVGENANNVYMRASTMREQLMAQGYYGEDLEKMMSDLKDAGMKFLSVDNIQKLWVGGGNLAKELGETTNAGFIKALYDAGFGKGSIQKIYDQMAENGQYLEGTKLTPEEIASAVDQVALEESDPSLAANESTADNTLRTATTLDSIATKLGILTETDKQTIQGQIDKFNADWGESVEKGELTQNQKWALPILENYSKQLETTIEDLQSRGFDTSEFEEYKQKIDETIKSQDLIIDANKELVHSQQLVARQRAGKEEQDIQNYVAETGMSEGYKQALKLEITEGDISEVEESLIGAGFTKAGAKDWIIKVRPEVETTQTQNASNSTTETKPAPGLVSNVDQIPLDIDTQPAEEKTSELATQMGMSMQDGATSGLVNGTAAGASTARAIAEGTLSNLHGSATISLKTLAESFTVFFKGKSETGYIRNGGAAAYGMNLDMIPGYAKGRIKGGKETALTGELGYEVAWFPSQGTSTILGLNGPEMVDLPKDAVIFPHKQSKKIVEGNKNRPQFGSHPDGENYVGGTVTRAETGGGSSGGTIDPKSKKNIEKTTKATEKIDKTTTTAFKNLNLKLSQIADRLSLNMDLIKRYLESSGASQQDLYNKKYYQDYKKDLEQQEKLSKDLTKEYKKQLNTLKKTGKKAGGKNAIKEEVSYGKKKSVVNLNKYIKFNKDTGLYELNNKALKKVGNKTKRNAIGEAAQKFIEDLTSKYTKQKEATLDAIQKQEELAKLVDDTFYNWEMELKRIHEISKQLETLSKRQTRYQSAYELEQSRAQVGFDTEASINNMMASLDRQREVMSQRIQLSGEKIKEAQKQVIDILNPESTQQQAALAKAKDYYKLELRPDGTYDYDIDTAALEARYKAGKLSETDYKDIKDVLDKLEGAMGELEDAVNDQLTTLKELYDVLNDQRQKMADYEQTLLEGLQKEIEKEINNQKTISASITNQLKKLYDEVKKAIDMRRRAEDNAKTEADIQKKQQRLAMLRADTSGGNALEIAQLEKEIGDAQQSYQRTLEDQLIQDLQDQADKAAEQRDEQIELMSLLNQTSTSIETNIAKINEWIAHPEEHEADIRNALNAAYGGEDPKTYFASLINEGKVNEAYNEIVALKNSIPLTEEAIKTVNSSVDGIISRAVGTDGAIKVEQINGSTGKSGGGGVPQPTKTLTPAQQNRKNDLNQLIKSKENEIANWQKELKIAKGLPKTKVNKGAVYDIENKIKALNSELSNLKKEYNSFATGGLNTSTGPAWLDGTKSKPELVLNATDTKNFLQLKDVLSHVMKGAAALPDTSAGESNTYEININVDHLNNDYDVDKVAERVKKIIVKDSSYRNVTAVRKFR